MKSFMKFATGFVLSVFVMCSYGAPKDVSTLSDAYSNLSPEQKQTFLLQLQNNTKEPESVTVIDNMTKLAQIGEVLGKGLAATAKELGIAANEFAKSDVGKITMVLIVWNYMGEDIVSIIGTIIWFLIAIPLWYFSLHKRMVFSVSGYKKVKKYSIFRGVYEVDEENYNSPDTDYYIVSLIVLLCIVVFGVFAL